jgi:hypothetical protein
MSEEFLKYYALAAPAIMFGLMWLGNRRNNTKSIDHLKMEIELKLKEIQAMKEGLARDSEASNATEKITIKVPTMMSR